MPLAMSRLIAQAATKTSSFKLPLRAPLESYERA